MKIFILSIVFLCAQSAYSQLVDLLIHPPAGSMINVRDAIKTSDEKLLLGVDINVTGAAIVKMDNAGTVDWAKSLLIGTGNPSCSYNVAQKSDGNYYLHGLTMDANGQNVFLIEITPSGTLVFAKNYFLSNSGEYAINKMSLAANGDLVFMASQYDQIIAFRTDPSGNLLWGKSFMNSLGVAGKNPGFDLTIFPDESMIICGKHESSLALIKLASDGTVIFTKTHLIHDYFHAKAIMLNPDGDIVISGCGEQNQFTNPFILLMELDGNTGNINWAKAIGAGSYYLPQSMTIKNERITTTFGIADTITWDFQQITVEYDLDGNIINAWELNSDLILDDYISIKEFNSNKIIYGGLTADLGLTYVGFVYEIESFLSSGCLLNWSDQSNADFTNYTEDTQDPIVATSFVNESTIPVILTDILITTSSMCEVLGTPKLDGSNQMITVSPNPSNGVVKFNNVNSSSKIEIRDLQGKLINSETAMYSNPTIDLSSQSAGIYFYSIQTDLGIQTGKIVIE